MFLAKCKDFHNSPFAAPGVACPAAAWECLFCPLAVITPSKAPALIALKRRLEGLRDTMPLDHWHQVYGAAHRVLGEEILPQFSAATVERAEALAKDRSCIYHSQFTPRERLARPRASLLGFVRRGSHSAHDRLPTDHARHRLLPLRRPCDLLLAAKLVPKAGARR